MTEPLVIRKLKKLGQIAGGVSLSYNPDYIFSLWDDVSEHTFPKSYREVMEDLDERIAAAKEG